MNAKPSAFCLATALIASGASACDVALTFAVDVSSSIDDREYAVQMEGLATALRDPIIADVLVRGQAALSVVQWSGYGQQEVSVGWTSISRPQDLTGFTAALEAAPRVWDGFPTAIGDALQFVRGAFEDAPTCQRRVIDISGDGRSNEGAGPHLQRAALAALDITVNALVIEEEEEGLPEYFRDSVIAGPDAFVLTAAGFSTFTETMRRKLYRELMIQLVLLER